MQLGPRELREVYAEPFAAAIREAGLATVMSSYSCVDGLAGSGSAELLTRLLRDELGFEGMVVADYFAVTLLMSYHRVAADREAAAIRAITAGVDLELPVLDCFNEPLKSAISAGTVPIAVVDRALRRVLSAKVKLGLFESPYVELAKVNAVFNDPANANLARRAATRGIVMLTNNGVLPLSADISKLAVVGPAADDRRLLQGDYHYPAHQELIFDQEMAPSHDGPGPSGPSGREDASPGPNLSVDWADTIFLPSGPGRFRPGAYYTEHVTPLAGLRGRAGVRGRGCL